MTVEKISDGLWRWSIAGPDGRARESYYYEAAEAVVLVDPAIPEEGDPQAARFWRALDGDVARLARPVVVLVAERDRVPSAARVLARYRESAGCRVVRFDA